MIDSIRYAKKIAADFGVELAGWNDKPGREHISLQGDGEKLEAVKKRLELEGWHVWPQAPEEEGWSMQFSLAPAPATAPATGLGMTVQKNANLPPVTGDTFYYVGGGDLWLNNMMVGFVLMFIALSQGMTAGFHVSPRSAVVAVAVFFLINLPLLAANWVAVRCDADKLSVRKHFFGKVQEFPYGTIKNVRLIREKRRYGTTEYLGLNFTSGKMLDLFLPARKRAELQAFLKDRMERPAALK